MILFLPMDDEDYLKLEAIYNQYKNLMKHIAMQVLQNECLADDVVHDTILALSKCLDDIDEIVCRKTYGLVVLISRRLSLNKFKYEKRRRHETDEILDFTVSKEKMVDDIVYNNIIIDELKAQLMKLGKTDFEIIILKYYYGYSYKEISKFINLSPSAIQKRCERGRKKVLKELIEGGE